MKTFNIKIIANNSQWASWPEKIQAIKDFYASVCTLNISIEYTSLKPKFAVYSQATLPGQQPVYFMDEAWYQANVLRPGADIGILVIPPTDHLNLVTLFGCEMGNPRQEWETVVFGNEKDHLYVSAVDKGNSIVWYMIHELSHVFYAMLQKPDNTHLYFNQSVPGATWNPTLILTELTFPVTMINKKKIYEVAAACLHQHLTLNASIPPDVGCAEAVSTVLKKAGIFGIPSTGIAGTSDLYQWLLKNPKFKQTNAPSAGSIIISPTGTSSKGTPHGHVGIVANYGVLSNDSDTGLFLEKYTLPTWKNYFGTALGFPVYYFDAID